MQTEPQDEPLVYLLPCFQADCFPRPLSPGHPVYAGAGHLQGSGLRG